MNSKNKEAEIFGLEKKLIKEYFNGVRPRTIKIVDDVDFDGKAGTKLEISRDFLKNCTKEELIALLKHELIHYKLSQGDYHSDRFIEESERVGLKVTEYVLERNYEEGLYLGCAEERIEKDGSCTLIEHKKPQWRLFEETLLNSEHRGSAFRVLRKRIWISQKELAKRAGISLYMVRKIENSKYLIFMREFDEVILKRLFQAIFKHWR